MRKYLLSIIYLAAHAALFAALFVPPIFIPNHGHGGWEYHLALFLTWWPGCCFAGGVAAGLTPYVPRNVRIAAAAMLVIIGLPAVLLSHVCLPQGLALEAVAYGGGLLLGRIAHQLIRQTLESLHHRQKRRSEK